MNKVSQLFAEEIREAVEKDRKEQRIDAAKSLLDLLAPEVIAKVIGLDIADVRQIMEDNLMNQRAELIRKKHEDYWQWIGTSKHETICAESLIDEMIEHETKQLEKSGRELLDIYVTKSINKEALPFVHMEFLSRPKAVD